MHVYFVRHGESEGNVAMVYQGDDAVLSAEGIAQSSLLALRMKELPVDTIISSDLARARVTAEIIGDVLKKEVAYVPLFRELILPNELIGLPLSHKKSIRIRKMRIANQDDPDWRYSNEENFFDATARADDALKVIEQLRSECVIVVTHSHFVFHLVARVIFPQGLSPEDFLQFKKHMDIANTGVTLCEYDKKKQTWKLLSWNNDANLE